MDSEGLSAISFEAFLKYYYVESYCCVFEEQLQLPAAQHPDFGQPSTDQAWFCYGSLPRKSISSS